MTRGTQKHKIPVIKNNPTLQHEALQPIENLTIVVCFHVQILHGSRLFSTISGYFPFFRDNCTMIFRKAWRKFYHLGLNILLRRRWRCWRKNPNIWNIIIWWVILVRILRWRLVSIWLLRFCIAIWIDKRLLLFIAHYEFRGLIIKGIRIYMILNVNRLMTFYFY